MEIFSAPVPARWFSQLAEELVTEISLQSRIMRMEPTQRHLRVPLAELQSVLALP